MSDIEGRIDSHITQESSLDDQIPLRRRKSSIRGRLFKEKTNEKSIESLYKMYKNAIESKDHLFFDIFIHQLSSENLANIIEFDFKENRRPLMTDFVFQYKASNYEESIRLKNILHTMYHAVNNKELKSNFEKLLGESLTLQLQQWAPVNADPLLRELLNPPIIYKSPYLIYNTLLREAKTGDGHTAKTVIKHLNRRAYKKLFNYDKVLDEPIIITIMWVCHHLSHCDRRHLLYVIRALYKNAFEKNKTKQKTEFNALLKAFDWKDAGLVRALTIEKASPIIIEDELKEVIDKYDLTDLPTSKFIKNVSQVLPVDDTTTIGMRLHDKVADIYALEDQSSTLYHQLRDLITQNLTQPLPESEINQIKKRIVGLSSNELSLLLHPEVEWIRGGVFKHSIFQLLIDEYQRQSSSTCRKKLLQLMRPVYSALSESHPILVMDEHHAFVAAFLNRDIKLTKLFLDLGLKLNDFSDYLQIQPEYDNFVDKWELKREQQFLKAINAYCSPDDQKLINQIQLRKQRRSSKRLTNSLTT